MKTRIFTAPVVKGLSQHKTNIRITADDDKVRLSKLYIIMMKLLERAHILAISNYFSK